MRNFGTRLATCRRAPILNSTWQNFRIVFFTILRLHSESLRIMGYAIVLAVHSALQLKPQQNIQTHLHRMFSLSAERSDSVAPPTIQLGNTHLQVFSHRPPGVYSTYVTMITIACLVERRSRTALVSGPLTLRWYLIGTSGNTYGYRGSRNQCDAFVRSKAYDSGHT